MRATIVKVSPSGGQSLEEIDLALQQLVSEAVGSQGIVDVLEQAGVKRPDISVFSDEFLAEIAGMEQRNLAREMLERLLRDEITVRSRQNAVQARKFSDMLDEALKKYESRSVTTMQLIEHLIEFAKELRDEPKRAESMGLSEEEVAFYDALAGEQERPAGPRRRTVTRDRPRPRQERARERDDRLELARERPRWHQTENQEDLCGNTGTRRKRPTRPPTRSWNRRNCSVRLPHESILKFH